MKSNQSPVAIITGSARRIGAIIARFLHENGFNVVIHYRASETDANALRDELNAARQNSAITAQADLNQLDQLSQLVNAPLQTWNRVDALINNASDYFSTPLNTANEAQWNALMNSNVKGPYFLCQRAAQALQKTHGAIVNISDYNAQKPLKDHSIFCIAKAAQDMLTKSLALELSPNVRVNAVAPGTMLWGDGDTHLDEAAREALLQKTLLHTLVDPMDVAKMVLFLIEQRSMTSEIITINAGRK